MRLSSLLLSVSLLLIVGAITGLQAQEQGLSTRVITTGLDTPWEILWGPDGWIWMTERGGRISRVNPETGEVRELLTIPEVYENTESGLFGMVVWAGGAIPRAYLVYTYFRAGNIYERLSVFIYEDETLKQEAVLIDSIPASTNHDGSRLLITPDNKLLMTTGDALQQSAAQQDGDVRGKVLRINLDGSVPEDNPWADAPWPGNLVWTKGHRNPQGLVLASNGILYSSEHGPNTDDEVNIIEEGRNYGWPFVHGYCDNNIGDGEEQFCQDSNVVEPLRAWTPTLAVCGLDYYDHANIPEWRNSLLMVSLREGDLRQLKLSENGREILEENIYYDQTYGRLRDLCIAPDGRVFIATSNRDGRGNGALGFPREDDDKIVEISSTAGSVPLRASVTASVVPHPVDGSATISFSKYLGPGTVEIYNATGVLVHSRSFSGGMEYHLVRGHLEAGVYVVKAIPENSREYIHSLIVLR